MLLQPEFLSHFGPGPEVHAITTKPSITTKIRQDSREKQKIYLFDKIGPMLFYDVGMKLFSKFAILGNHCSKSYPSFFDIMMYLGIHLRPVSSSFQGAYINVLNPSKYLEKHLHINLTVYLHMY